MSIISDFYQVTIGHIKSCETHIHTHAHTEENKKKIIGQFPCVQKFHTQVFL